MLLKDSWPACHKNALYSIPNLQFNVLVVDSNHLGSEFNSDSHFMLLPKAFIDELEEQAGLPDTYAGTRWYLCPR